MLKAESAYPRQSSADRKMSLYDDIISYFDKGKVIIMFVDLLTKTNHTLH